MCVTKFIIFASKALVEKCKSFTTVELALHAQITCHAVTASRNTKAAGIYGSIVSSAVFAEDILIVIEYSLP